MRNEKKNKENNEDAHQMYQMQKQDKTLREKSAIHESLNQDKTSWGPGNEMMQIELWISQ